MSSSTALSEELKLCHQNLIEYTQKAPELLALVDASQFQKLTTKYHHLLVRCEKLQTALRKKIEVYQRLEEIVLQSDLVQDELQSIERLQNSISQLQFKNSLILDGLRKFNSQASRLDEDNHQTKLQLLQEKNKYFGLRNTIEESTNTKSKDNSKENAYKKLPKVSPKLKTVRHVSKPSFSIQSIEEQVTTTEAVCEFISSLHRLQSSLFSMTINNTQQAIKNSELRMKLRSRWKLLSPRSTLLDWNGRQIMQEALESANKSPYLQPKQTLSMAKSRDRWPQMASPKNQSTIKCQNLNKSTIDELETLSGQELFTRLCKAPEKLEHFYYQINLLMGFGHQKNHLELVQP